MNTALDFDAEMQMHFDLIRHEWEQQIVADRVTAHLDQLSQLMLAWINLTGLNAYVGINNWQADLCNVEILCWEAA